MTNNKSKLLELIDDNLMIGNVTNVIIFAKEYGLDDVVYDYGKWLQNSIYIDDEYHCFTDFILKLVRIVSTYNSVMEEL